MQDRFDDAVREFRAAAGEGSTDAMVWLGVCYKSGRGVPEDENAAVKWFKQAANNGNAKAMFRLGNYHENAALKWYERAAEQRNEDAVKALARFTSSSSAVRVKGKDSVDSAAIDRQVAGSGTAGAAAGGASNVASPAVKVEATGSGSASTSDAVDDEAVAQEAKETTTEAKEASKEAKVTPRRPHMPIKTKPVAQAETATLEEKKDGNKDKARPLQGGR
jgi:TPR repeat protein